MSWHHLGVVDFGSLAEGVGWTKQRCIWGFAGSSVGLSHRVGGRMVREGAGGGSGGQIVCYTVECGFFWKPA